MIRETFKLAVPFLLAALFSVSTAQAQTPAKPEFISRPDAVKIALSQASGLSRARLEEQVAREDVFQAKKAFLPRFSANPGLIYTSPTLRATDPGIPRQPSYLGANAVEEYQGLVTASGEIDTSGKLRAERSRALALLDAAKSGTEAARRNLINATEEAYLAYSLAEARKHTAEVMVASAKEFENATRLLVSGGEAAPVDILRAQVQTASRQDEFAVAQADSDAARENLRVYLGDAPAEIFSVSDLQTLLPEPGDLEQFALESVDDRPELKQLTAEAQAAHEEAKAAKSERRPQFKYSIDGGLISDSLRPSSLGSSAGVRVTVSMDVPLFDWGISKSRETQAELKAKASEDSLVFAKRIYEATFKSSLLHARSSAGRIRDLATNVANAERILTVAVDRYKAGETQIIEVTDAQTQIVDQRNALLKAIYDYQIALSRLRQSTGK